MPQKGTKTRALVRRDHSELAREDEAMLLYDAAVAGLGQLRIVEHFTVHENRIVCLRQIHDTVAIRTAGLGA